MQSLYIQLGNNSSVTDIWIKFNQITAAVSDSAAYYKKAYREVLLAVFPNSVHVLCLAHIVNLAADVLHHHYEVMHTCDLGYNDKVFTFQEA